MGLFSFRKSGGAAPHKQDGPWSWVVLGCACVVIWLSGGIGTVFGIFLPVLVDEFNETRDKVALVGSLRFAFYLCLTIISSQLCDRYSCRLIGAIGHVISAAGFLLSSFPNSIIPMYFSYSLIFGFGCSCIQSACYLIVGQYFKKRRSLAFGIVASTVGIGTICWGPLVQSLLDIMSWRYVLRVIAIVFMALMFLTFLYDPDIEKDGEYEELDQNAGDQKGFLKSIFDFSIWKVPVYRVAVISNMIACFGHYTARIHMIKYALEMGVDPDKASTLFIFYGCTSIISRIAAGCLCNVKSIKPNYVNQAAQIISGVSTIVLAQSRTYTHLIIFSLFYGVADGAFRTTRIILFMDCVGPARMAAAYGQANMMSSFFAAAGPAVVGLVAEHYGSYTYAFYFAGCTTLLGSLVYLSLFFIKEKPEASTKEFLIKQDLK